MIEFIKNIVRKNNGKNFLFDGFDFKDLLLEFDQLYESNNARLCMNHMFILQDWPCEPGERVRIHSKILITSLDRFWNPSTGCVKCTL